MAAGHFTGRLKQRLNAMPSKVPANLAAVVGCALLVAAMAVPASVSTGQVPPTDQPATSTADLAALQKKMDDAASALSYAINTARLAEPKPRDDAYRALLRRRLEAAAREASGQLMAFQVGSTQGTFPGLLQSIGRRVEAELALIDVQADRVAALQRIVTVAAAIDAVNGFRFDAGRMTIQELMLSHQFLVDCQLAVLDAKSVPPAIRAKLAFPPAPAPVPRETDPAKRKQANEKLIAETMPLLQQMLTDQSIGLAQPGDDERRKLFKERHRALQQGFAGAFGYFQAGVPGATIIEVFGSPRRLAESAAELNSTPANLLAIAERTLLIARVLEAIDEVSYDANRLPVQGMAASQVNRLTAEMALLELRTRFPNVVPLRPNPVAPEKPADGKPPQSEKLQVTDAEMAELYRVFPEPGKPSPPARTLPVPPEPIASDSERQRLLKNRLKYATIELEARTNAFEAWSPRGHPPDILEALDRYRSSALALAKTPGDRLAVEELVGLLTRAVTTVTKIRVNAGGGVFQDHLRFVAARADSQLRLLDAKKSVSAPAQPPEKKP
jgi:hypothetical protein